MRSRTQSINLNLPKSLHDDMILTKTVESILSSGIQDARRFIGKTTITAYRRVHEILVVTLDRLIEEARSGAQAQFSRLMVELSKCLILIKYQFARDQLSRPLADSLSKIIQEVINVIKNNQSRPEMIESTALRARTILDALAVLVYQYS